MTEHLLRSPVNVANLRERLSFVLHLSSWCSGDLAWFTRKPVFIRQDSKTPEGIQTRFASESVYLHWQESCRSKLESIVQEWPQGISASQMRGVLSRYWEAVDQWVPGLPSSPVLAAIRET